MSATSITTCAPITAAEPLTGPFIKSPPGLASIAFRLHAWSLPAAQVNNWNTLYAEVLGLVSQSQTLYTRQGPNLSLQPLGTPAFDQSIIPYYNVYFSDAWRMKPRFTLTYGVGYSIEMPPYEINGKQVEVVDQSGNPIDVADYLASRKQAALAGQATIQRSDSPRWRTSAAD